MKKRPASQISSSSSESPSHTLNSIVKFPLKDIFFENSFLGQRRTGRAREFTIVGTVIPPSPNGVTYGQNGKFVYKGPYTERNQSKLDTLFWRTDVIKKWTTLRSAAIQASSPSEGGGSMSINDFPIILPIKKVTTVDGTFVQYPNLSEGEKVEIEQNVESWSEGPSPKEKFRSAYPVQKRGNLDKLNNFLQESIPVRQN